jgi:hypothetical protein
VEQSTNLEIQDCNIRVSCGRDGTWLHFEASNAPSVAINIENLAERHNGGVIKNGLLGWCEDRQRDAQKVNEDNGQFGVGKQLCDDPGLGTDDAGD